MNGLLPPMGLAATRDMGAPLPVLLLCYLGSAVALPPGAGERRARPHSNCCRPS